MLALLVILALIIIAAYLTLLVYGIRILIIAFQRSLWWGLGCLFLFPICIAFLFAAWDDVKTPFLRSLMAFFVAASASAAFVALPRQDVVNAFPAVLKFKKPVQNLSVEVPPVTGITIHGSQQRPTFEIDISQWNRNWPHCDCESNFYSRRKRR